MRPVFRLLGVAGLMVSLAACSGVPVGSVAPLARVNVETTRLSELRVAVLSPETVRPGEGGVVLNVGLSVAGQPDRSESLVLVAEKSPSVAPPQRSGWRAETYRLAEADQKKFEALRVELAAARSARQKGSLAIGLGVQAFCRVSGNVPRPLPLAGYVATAETGGYVPLIEVQDIAADPRVAAELGRMPAC